MRVSRGNVLFLTDRVLYMTLKNHVLVVNVLTMNWLGVQAILNAPHRECSIQFVVVPTTVTQTSVKCASMVHVSILVPTRPRAFPLLAPVTSVLPANVSTSNATQPWECSVLPILPLPLPVVPRLRLPLVNAVNSIVLI